MVNGLPGHPGLPGPYGRDGMKGEKGATGANGAKGEVGAQAPSNWKQCVWRSGDGRDYGLIKVNIQSDKNLIKHVKKLE